MEEEFRYPADRYLLLGRVAKAHGLRGEVKLFLYSGQPENVGRYRELSLVDRRGTITPPLEILSVRLQGKAAIVLFATIADRNGAENIEGCGLLLERGQLPEPEDDEYYWHGLLGKRVVDQGGTYIGTIKSLFDNGAHDILVVDGPRGEVLIPVTRSIVVGESETEVVVDPPPGLLELGQ